MLRRFGLRAMTMGVLLSAGPSLWADEPLYTPGRMEQGAIYPATGTATAVDSVSAEVVPAGHASGQSFDAYRHFDDQAAKACHTNPGRRYHRHGHGHGHKCDDGGNDSFTVANPWGGLDFEKRFFWSFNPRNAQGGATRSAYGDCWGTQIGAEFLPWVITDGSNHYSRWGFTTAFDYSDYEGGSGTTLQSIATRTFLTIGDGESYGFVLGPTYRVDFDFHGVRMSPNATIGAHFDWINLRERQPNNLNIRRIDKFKYSGFDCGMYAKLMWDFGLTDNINLGLGMDFKFIPTDVMTRDNEARKHLGFVLSLSHQF